MAKIPIVDDSGTMRKIIMRGIRQAGLQAATFAEAGDGLQGLEALEGRCGSHSSRRSSERS